MNPFFYRFFNIIINSQFFPYIDAMALDFGKRNINGMGLTVSSFETTLRIS